ncbi:hypothetical protein Sjap_006031 [Stephania japonica]|uniref:Uncharacterized protein n=1 Tax=Stephania japonica TaxID=461633 RepID=A0AAP0K545_9MAGN
MAWNIASTPPSQTLTFFCFFISLDVVHMNLFGSVPPKAGLQPFLYHHYQGGRDNNKPHVRSENLSQVRLRQN